MKKLLLLLAAAATLGMTACANCEEEVNAYCSEAAAFNANPNNDTYTKAVAAAGAFAKCYNDNEDDDSYTKAQACDISCGDAAQAYCNAYKAYYADGGQTDANLQRLNETSAEYVACQSFIEDQAAASFLANCLAGAD